MLRAPPFLLILAIAHASGIALADCGLVPLEASLVAAWTALAWGVVTPARRVRATCAVVAVAAAGAIGLAGRVEAAARDRPATPVEVTLDARVARLARLDGGLRVLLEGCADAERRHAVPSRVQLRVDPEDVALATGLAGVEAGARVRLRVRLRAAAGLANPGVADRARATARAGIGASARLVHPRLAVRIDGGGTGLGAHVTALRRRVSARLEAAGPGGALLAALAVGERGAFPPAARDAFAKLGLSHLLSVSGLHLVLVASAAYALARAGLGRAHAVAARRDVRVLALAPALAVAAAYTGLTGGEVPVRRSLVFLAAAVLARLSRRPAHGGAAVAGAALAVLAVEPEALFDAGAQMSFAASAALVAAPPLAGLAGRARAVAALLGTTAVATAATAPFVATQLGVVQPAGLVANLVAVPWTGFVLMPAAFAGATLAALPDGRWGDVALGLTERVAWASCEAVIQVASVVPPVASSGAPAPAWIAMAALCALGAVAARRLAPRTACALAGTLLLAAAPAVSIRPPAPRVVALDVGQGSATLIQGRHGAVLIDGGSAGSGLDLGAAAVVPALRALGVRRLDLLVASHADLDHRGGLPAVVAALPVGEVWLPASDAEDEGFEGLRAAATRVDVPVRESGAGDPSRRFGDLEVRALWPPREAPLALGSGRNDRSLVVRVAVGARSVLVPGDLEAAGERALLASGAALASDVLALGHHGSRTSSTPAFLTAVDPRVAIASAPCHGRFGMPHAEALARAARAGVPVWWTGRDGALLVALEGPLAAFGWATPASRCRAEARR